MSIEAEARLSEARERVRRIADGIEARTAEIERMHVMMLAVVERAGVDLRVLFGEASELPPLPQRRPARERPIRVMWAKGKLPDGLMLAAERVTLLLRSARAGQAVARWVGDRDGSSGGGADALANGMARQLDAAAQWGMLTARMLLDQRCGVDVEHRRLVIGVVEHVCGAEMSIVDVARLDRFGSRHLIGRRLKAGLTVVAESIGDVRAHQREAGEAFVMAMAEREAA